MTRQTIFTFGILITLSWSTTWAEAAPLSKSTHVYRTVDGVDVAADVYRPDGNERRPVVVWIHGGALIVGSRTSVPANLLDYCSRQRFILVSLDYRLAPEVKLPAIIDDLQTAFAWLHEHGPRKLGADMRRVVVVGGSAGGFLTFMAGAVVQPRPTALVAYWGYGDLDAPWGSAKSTHHGEPLERNAVEGQVGGRVLTNTDGPSQGKDRGLYYRYLRQQGLWVSEVTGLDPQRQADELAKLSPVHNVTPDYPPTLMIHGTADTDVPYSSSQAMAEQFTKYKVRHELITIAGAEHGLRDGDKTQVAAAHERALKFIGEALADRPGESGQFYQVSYPPSTVEGQLPYGVTYTLWLPENVQRVRGVIVHQHGCGAGACQGGATAAYDLHWQSLARKWDCVLLGPSYHQKDGQNCRLWCDPRNGSRTTFLRALDEFALQSERPEIATAPWCLWGHSGGGFWASLMQTSDPERIVALWFRSGTAFSTWEKGEIAKPDIPAAAYAIPAVCNPGAKEKDDKRFNNAWTGGLAMFQAYRAQGAPIAFAPDPRTAHECGDSRYLAIPFFDACLALRLPDVNGADTKLKPVQVEQGWLAGLDGTGAAPADQYSGKASEAVWLPNERVAQQWAEYIKTGATSDTTPPPAPSNVRATTVDQGIEITWTATADFESGIQAFVIQRDGVQLGQVPEAPKGRFGRPLFQSMSYHDTPEKPLPAMIFIDRSPPADKRASYRVTTINGVGLRSAATTAP
jgi:acetyl esterase/lipase